MIEHKLISIIIPIYNASTFLDECLSSIRAQIYNHFEVICVDDGSTDNSVDIVLKFTESDKRFRLYSQLNSGVSVARNTGLKHACGEYICFIDADDMVEPNYLKALYDISEAGFFPICSYTQDYSKLNQKKQHTSRCSSRELISKIINESIEHPNLWAMMFKFDVINKFELDFFPGCVRNEDTEFYMKYLVNESRDVIITDYQGYYYRDNPNSAMHITKRNAFTTFGAAERIKMYLNKKGIIDDYDKVIFAAVQGFLFRLAKENNKDLYEELHSLYDVKAVMSKLLHHPKVIRRLVALIYLVLGRYVFFKAVTLMGKIC